MSDPIEKSNSPVPANFSLPWLDVESSTENAMSIPSPIWKAYSYALRSCLTTDDGDLSKTGQAIYIASPFQSGVPAGAYIDDAITNYYIYTKVDPIQKADRPFYDITSDSYFERLCSYLRYCVNPKLSLEGQQKVENLRLEYSKAVRKCNVAYKDALVLFEKTLQAGAKITFQEYMDKYAVSYKDAWDYMEKKRNEYQKVLDTTMSGVKQRLDAIGPARSHMVSQTGSNMPCAAVDLKTILAIRSSVDPRPVESRDIFYLPRYTINDLDIEVDNWSETEVEARKDPKVFKLDLDGLSAKPWALLGFPNLDKQRSTPLTPSESKLQIRLKVIFLKAFDVFPGLWDVHNVRLILPDLAESAPDVIKEPFMKTTKILLARDIEIEVRMRLGESDTLESLLDKENISILGVQITAQSIQNGIATVRGSNSRIPALLAVLAEKC